VVAEAKHEAMLGKVDGRISLADERRAAKIEEEKEKVKRNAGKYKLKRKEVKNDKVEQVATVEEEEVGEDVPWFMKNNTNKYPFSNVRMAFRVGPLIIENGVNQ
jgi:hypothetical protein